MNLKTLLFAGILLLLPASYSFSSTTKKTNSAGNGAANPFTTWEGHYAGLALFNPGSFMLNISDRGTYSGKLQYLGKTVRLSGSFTTDGQASQKVRFSKE